MNSDSLKFIETYFSFKINFKHNYGVYLFILFDMIRLVKVT